MYIQLAAVWYLNGPPLPGQLVPAAHSSSATYPIVLHYSHRSHQDLKAFLGVTSNRIYDIFHDEDSPSGSIFQNSSNGHWLYRCHSTSASFAGTVVEITSKLLGCSIQDAKEFLVKVYKITLVENETQKRLREAIDDYKLMLQSEDLEELYPNFYKLFNRHGYFDNLYIVLDLIKENLPADSDNPRLLFHHSINTLSKKFMKSTTNTGIRMNFLTFFKMIWKLDDKEVPKELFNYQKRHKVLNKHKYHNTTYELRQYDYDLFSDLEEMSKDWISRRLTTKTMNYEGILLNYGQDEADRVFPQDKGKKVSDLHEDVIQIIEQTTMKLIAEKGWTIEKEILENVKLYFKGQKRLKEDLIKVCIGDLLDKYDLHVVNGTKQLKLELGITEEQLSIRSFPKIILRNT